MAVLLLASAGSGIGAESRESQISDTLKGTGERAALRERFSRCVAPQGLMRVLPLASGAGVPALDSAWVRLSDRGTLSHGYFHDLYIAASPDTAYIVQTGGMNGARRVYGPLSLARGCDEFPVIGSGSGGNP